MTIIRFIWCAIFLALVSKSYAIPPNRIVGGNEAQKDEFPYAVSLRVDNAHICGGSILNERKVITAAHCVTVKTRTDKPDLNRLSIRAGSTNQYSGGKVLKISKIDLHPSYGGLKNDLAILTLSEPLIWSDRIKSIPYAKEGTRLPAAGSQVKTAGWGELSSGTSPYKLQYTVFTVASEEECKNAFKDKDESTVCLAHNLKEGSCRGDAGNGAIYDSTLIAISNFVVGACGSRYPDIYLDVAHHSKWIDSVLLEN